MARQSPHVLADARGAITESGSDTRTTAKGAANHTHAGPMLLANHRGGWGLRLANQTRGDNCPPETPYRYGVPISVPDAPTIDIQAA